MKKSKQYEYESIAAQDETMITFIIKTNKTNKQSGNHNQKESIAAQAETVITIDARWRPVSAVGTINIVTPVSEPLTVETENVSQM